MKKILIGLGLVLAVLVLARVIILPRLAPSLFERAVAERLSSDLIGDLGDGLHVILVGTGSPLPDPSRAGPMTAVIVDGRLFVFDAGDGATRRMGEIGLNSAQVKRVFLTHLHSDHIDGLGALMLARWAGSGATEPLPIAGPDGTGSVVDGLMQAYTPDRGFRIAHHGADIMPESGFGGAVETVSDGWSWTEGNVQITAVRVSHAPVEPAFGYLIEHGGKRVFITGDSTSDIRLPSSIGPVDLLVAEALNPELVKIMEDKARELDRPRLAKIFYDIPDYHMSPIDAAELGERLGAERVILTHIVPAAPNRIVEGLFMRGLDAELGYDGMVISLRD